MQGRIRRWRFRALAAGGAILGVLGLVALSPAVSLAKQEAAPKFHPFTITSPNFRDGAMLPVSSEWNGGGGCAGQNQAPELRWSNVPSGTLSFAFTINDPDAPIAGGWHHWVVYNIPASVRELEGHGQNPYSEGTTSFGQVGYGGPCPPADHETHHYIFNLIALSTASLPGEHITFEQLQQEEAPYVLGATSIIGTFHRPLP